MDCPVLQRAAQCGTLIHVFISACLLVAIGLDAIIVARFMLEKCVPKNRWSKTCSWALWRLLFCY